VWRDSPNYEFMAHSDNNLVSELTSPMPGSTLTSDVVTFEWSDVGADDYKIYVGSTPGATDVTYATSVIGTQRHFTNMPVNGSTLYVTLWAKNYGVWRRNPTDFEITAHNEN